MKSSRRKLRLLTVGAVLLLMAAAAFLRGVSLSGLLPSQLEGKRWQGENENEFCQISVFLPDDEKKSLEDIYSFRSKLSEELHKASLDTDKDYDPCVDAWCAFGKVKAVSESAAGDFSVIAVGGDYFAFHPLRLMSGSYFNPNDLMKDRLVLDEESAWRLFGGIDLTGMRVKVGEGEFVVAGVIEREKDKFSQSAYDSGMCIYMSYDAYAQILGEEANKAQEICCYEVVMPQPVKGFAYGVVSDKFPVGSGTVVNNSERFSLTESVKRLKNLSERSMQTRPVAFPYWENAARAVEDRCTLMYALSGAAVLLPLFLLIFVIVRGLKKAGSKVGEELIPKAVSDISEKIRVRQRRRWEKRNPGMR